MIDWLPPILGFLIFVTPMSEDDRTWALDWCAAKHPRAELRFDPIRLPWVEGMTIQGTQAVCLAPRLDPQL